MVKKVWGLSPGHSLIRYVINKLYIHSTLRPGVVSKQLNLQSWHLMLKFSIKIIKMKCGKNNNLKKSVSWWEHGSRTRQLHWIRLLRLVGYIPFRIWELWKVRKPQTARLHVFLFRKILRNFEESTESTWPLKLFIIIDHFLKKLHINKL